METESLTWNWKSPLLSILSPTTTGGNITLWFLYVISTGIVVAALHAHYMRQRALRFNLNGSSTPFQSAGIRRNVWQRRLSEELLWKEYSKSMHLAFVR
jgi:hypothetical protein